MISISEKSARALLEAAENTTKKNKTLEEAKSLVLAKLNEPQGKAHAQIENLRHIQSLALNGLTDKISEGHTYLKMILRTVNRAISGRPFEPSQSDDHRKKTPARAGKAKGQPC